MNVRFAIESLVVSLCMLPLMFGRLHRLSRSAIAGTLRMTPERRRQYFRATMTVPWVIFLVGILGFYASVAPRSQPWRIGAVVLLVAIFVVLFLPFLPASFLPKCLQVPPDKETKH